MLNALKRIEAKQASARAQENVEPVEPIAFPPDATPAEPIDLPTVLSADMLPSVPWEDFAPQEPVSLEATMDQLRAFVAEAGSLYDAEPEFDSAEFQEAAQPAATPLLIGPAVVEEPAAAVDLPPDVRSACEYPECPACSPHPVPPALVDEPATPVEEVPPVALPPTQDLEIDGPCAEFTQEKCPPETELPVATLAACDPYTATAHEILRRLPRGRSQALLFTSPGDGQGKTMTLARLAPLLARGLEGDVLVVDANFRNPDMARWLAAVPAWRLPDVLAGAIDWATAVQTTAHPRVSLLPGGSDAQGHGSGRNVPGMSHLLRDLAGHYDLVVVDASSLAHRGTAQLAALCDATYLVVRVGEGSPRMLREAVQVVQDNGGRLLGCVAIG